MRTFIKAIALDLDGTLLSSQQEIHPETLSSIQELSDRGCVVIVATARPVRKVNSLVPSWFRDYYWATCNGAWICRHGAVLARTEIPVAETLKLAMRLVKYGLQVRIEANDTFYTDGQLGSGSVGTSRPLREYQEFDACKILVFVNSEAQIGLVRESLSDQLSMVVTDGNQLVQVARKDCGKLNAVQAVLSMEGLGLQDLIAFGDDNNDIDLLRAAGFGIAMANGTPGVLKVADYVTKSNDQDGVGEVLRAVANGDPIGSSASRLR